MSYCVCSVANASDKAVTPGTGMSDPTLSFGLTSISDWSTEMPFLDITHSMRIWIGHFPNRWGGMTYKELLDGGYLDPDGWPMRIPPELGAIGTIWAWGGAQEAGSAAAQSRAGIYVLTYEGEGEIAMTLGAKILSSEPGRVVFENYTGTQMGMNIIATDPQGTGNYVRNISIVPERYEGLVPTGQIFNPDWLAVVEDARQLRFMDWMQTNGSGLAEWTDRPKTGDMTWAAGRGVPVEVLVQLANQTGTDPWFTMPAKASDDYIRQFATYVRDHLDPSLVAYAEYSNETWNWSFPQTRWLQEQAEKIWGEGKNFDYLAKRATETAVIWDEVFGEEAGGRVVNVLGVQNGWNWGLKQILKGAIWAKHEPGKFVSPASVFDAVAVTTYFGHSTVPDANLRSELLAAINNPDVDATAWLAARLADPGYASSIPQIEAAWKKIKKVTRAFGLDLLAYEGGQHVLHNLRVAGNDADTLLVFLTGFVRSSEMAELYRQLWDAWAEMSDGPFMQFTDVGGSGVSGAWGLLNALGDSNPRADFLFAQNAKVKSWFGDGGGTRYQQGVIKMAGDEGEILTGTDKDDFFVGGDGDDTFIGGKGKDAFNGGYGNDTIILDGSAADYEITQDGLAMSIRGLGRDYYLVGIENIEYKN